MGELKLFLKTKINREANLKYSPSDDFNPYELSGKAETEFLKEIAVE